MNASAVVSSVAGLAGASPQTAVRALGLPSVDRGLAAATRALYGRVLEFALADDALCSLHLQPVGASTAQLQLRVRVGGALFDVQVVDAGAIDDLCAPELPDALRRPLLLAATQAVREAFERQFGARLELLELRVRCPAWPQGTALGLRVRIGRPSGRAPAVALLVQALDAASWQVLCELGAGARVSPEAGADPSVSLRWFAPPIALSLTDLHDLGVGDLLVLARGAGPSGTLAAHVAVDAGWWPLWPWRFDAASSMVALADGRGGAARPLSFGGTMSEHQVDEFPGSAEWNDAPARSAASYRERPLPSQRRADADALAEAPGAEGLSALRMEVHVELGRLDMPMSQLQALASGQVFELPAAAEPTGLRLWCGGQMVARGQLVSVGDRLAVRVLAVTRGQEATRAPAEIELAGPRHRGAAEGLPAAQGGMRVQHGEPEDGVDLAAEQARPADSAFRC